MKFSPAGYERVFYSNGVLKYMGILNFDKPVVP